MSKIRVLTPGVMLSLKNQIPHNIEQYKTGSHEWLDEIFTNKRNT